MDEPGHGGEEERGDDGVELFVPIEGLEEEEDFSDDSVYFDDEIEGGAEGDDMSMVEDSDEGEDDPFEILLIDSSSMSSESDCENECSTTGLSVLMNDESVQLHGVCSSVRHPQCCDALAPVDCDEDKLICMHGEYALLYDVVDKKLLASAKLGFEAYSIAQYRSLFAAGGDNVFSIHQIVKDDQGTFTFKHLVLLQLSSHLYWGAMNNGLRFGLCGNELRLLVANQDHYMYMFSVPPYFMDQQKSQASTLPAECSGSSSTDACSSCGASSSSASSSGHCCSKSSPFSLSPLNPIDPSIFMCNNLQAGPVQEQAERNFRMVRCPVIGENTNGPDRVFETHVIGQFDHPINCTVPSPNGAWIAVVGDSVNVEILDYASGYSLQSRLLLPMVDNMPTGKRRDPRHGCQYAVWNSSSTMLAASSDAHRSVRVWSIRQQPAPPRMATRKTPCPQATTTSAELVASIGGNDLIYRPCLALQFDPLDDNIVYFTERAGKIHAMDLRCFKDSLEGERDQAGGSFQEEYVRVRQCQQVVSVRQRLRSKCPSVLVGCMAGHASDTDCWRANCKAYATFELDSDYNVHDLYTGPRAKSAKLTGLVASAKHGVLVSCKDRILQYPVLRKWSLQHHHVFPPSFKRSVAFLLLAAGRGQANRSGESNLVGSLPHEILFTVIGRAAMPVSAWTE